MQKEQVTIKDTIILDRCAKNCRKNNGGVTKYHGDHETHKHCMQGSIIEWPGIARTHAQVEDSSNTKPDESAKETNGNIASQWILMMDIAPGKIVFEEPES